MIAKKGSRLPYVAPWELKVSADYHWRLQAGRIGVVNLTYIHGNSSFSDITNTPATDNGTMNQVNLRAGVESNKKAWGIFGFVKNLTNSKSISTAQEASAGYGLRYPNYIQPRTIGIELRKEY